MEYRYLASSVGGFIQQLAVCYLRRGYWFYVVGEIPAGKDPTHIDHKLIKQYGIDLSKYQRCRRKKYGQASIQYLRYKNTFLLLSTNGEHVFFDKERGSIKDARRLPIECFSYSLTSRNGHVLVRIDQKIYRDLEAYFLELAIHRTEETLTWEFRNLPFESYTPIYRQLHSIWKAVNEKRQKAGFDPLPSSAIRRRRKIYRPFDPEELESTQIQSENIISV